MRIGFGLDRHRLQEGRPCILGGVLFADCPVGPLGHSDGDAVCHALADALLGAAALGDIGRHFPDTDARYKDADSMALLSRAAAMVRSAGWRVGNCDVTVMTEHPRIAPQVEAMAANLARALQADPRQISIKATRGEDMGPEGRGEAVTVHAVALLRQAKDDN
jgi:2-C-methyl-D-erythritol 2,4-cyclodiphosphate synthase